MCYLRYRGARIFTEYGLHFTPINIMFPDVRWQRAGRVRRQGARAGALPGRTDAG